MAKILTPKQKSAVERAKRNPGLQRILFSKAKGLEWFESFKQAGFLNPAEIPRPIESSQPGFFSIPSWPISEYLVSTREELKQEENTALAVEVRDFMRAATRHARDQGYTNFRAWWAFSKVISGLPVALVEDEDLAAVDFWLDDRYERGLIAEAIGEVWLFELLDQPSGRYAEIALRLVSMLFRTQKKKRKRGSSEVDDIVLRFDSWYAQKLTTKVAGKVGRSLGIAGISILQGSLEEVVADLNNDRWSSIWRPAIEDHEQNRSSDDAEDIILVAFREALLGFIDANGDASRDYVSKLLGSGVITVRRAAIFALDVQFERLKELLERAITPDVFDSHHRHEVWQLLHHRFPFFREAEKKRVRELITSLLETNDDGSQNPVATAYTHATWLSAIRSFDDVLAQLYRDAVAAAGAEPEHPDFASYMTVGWVNHESPIPEGELQSLTVAELVDRLKNYKEGDQGGREETGMAGLVKAVRRMVKAEPLKYYNQLAHLTSVDSAFVYEIIEAYSELWTEKAALPWDDIWPSLLRFCSAVVSAESFWGQSNADERTAFVGNRHWVVGAIGRLIEHGAKEDDRAGFEAHIAEARNILILLLKREEGSEFPEDSEAVSVAINSPRGRCVEALINLALRSCRTAHEASGEHSGAWKEFEPTFDSELARKGEYEFVTLISVYLANALYLDKEWTTRHLPAIFDGDDRLRWRCAMQGYAYVSMVYEPVYKFLRERGHLIRALNEDFPKGEVAKKVVQNIAVSYLNGNEDLSDATSLIRVLLQRGKSDELNHLVGFFTALRRAEKPNVKAKVIELWPKVFQALRLDSREGKLLASRLCDWTQFVDKIDDVSKDLMMQVLPFAAEGHRDGKLLEGIARFSEQQPEAASELWCAMLAYAQPTYPPEDITSALTNIAKTGAEGTRVAKRIVSIYMEKGYDEPAALLTKISIQSSVH